MPCSSAILCSSTANSLANADGAAIVLGLETTFKYPAAFRRRGPCFLALCSACLFSASASSSGSLPNAAAKEFLVAAVAEVAAAVVVVAAIVVLAAIAVFPTAAVVAAIVVLAAVDVAVAGPQFPSGQRSGSWMSVP